MPSFHAALRIACATGSYRDAEETEAVARWALDEIDRYRDALRRIADAESGPWGRIAHEALYPKAAKPQGMSARGART